MENVLLKVSNYQSILSTWNKLQQLLKAEALSMVGADHDKVKSLSEEIENLMKLEECMWSQRAKSDWLKYGDQNTKYLHCRSSERNKRNFIAGLENEVGDWIEDEGRVGDMIVNYYSGLFTSSNPLSLDPVLSAIEPRVSSTMNEDLDRPFEASEVIVALQQMESNTTPRPDGLPLLFYSNSGLRWVRRSRMQCSRFLTQLSFLTPLIIHC